ncbi:MAG: hypothetical protein QOE90_1594 [Thermoplasmata archaeon]|nr:hypothetical protein [Thermoplasmata archaeon]
MFRKQRAEPAPDEIPEELLATIPDVAPEPMTSFPVPSGTQSPDLHRAVAEMRRHLDAAVARELDQVEDSLSDLVEGLQARLEASEARVHALEAQNRAFAQRFAKLRELTADLDPRG